MAALAPRLQGTQLLPGRWDLLESPEGFLQEEPREPHPDVVLSWRLFAGWYARHAGLSAALPGAGGRASSIECGSLTPGSRKQCQLLAFLLGLRNELSVYSSMLAFILGTQEPGFLAPGCSWIWPSPLSPSRVSLETLCP